jgi:hypothetical protein
MVLDSCGHETFGWSQLYASDPDFATTYQALSECTLVENFHLQDGLMCHLGHLCVPSSEHAKIIWEAHYSRVERHFGVEKTVPVLQKYFYLLKIQHDCWADVLPNFGDPYSVLTWSIFTDYPS